MNLFGTAVENDELCELNECVAGFGVVGSFIDGPAWNFDGGMAKLTSLLTDGWFSPDSLVAVSFTTSAARKNFDIGSSVLVSLVPFGAFVVRADMNDAYELVIEVRR